MQCCFFVLFFLLHAVIKVLLCDRLPRFNLKTSTVKKQQWYRQFHSNYSLNDIKKPTMGWRSYNIESSLEVTYHHYLIKWTSVAEIYNRLSAHRSYSPDSKSNQRTSHSEWQNWSPGAANLLSNFRPTPKLTKNTIVTRCNTRQRLIEGGELINVFTWTTVEEISLSYLLSFDTSRLKLEVNSNIIHNT